MTARPVVIALLFTLLLGCQSRRNKDQQKAPRPVSVLTLTVSDPSRFERLTGSVEAWKTEDIAFEVAGRVRYVIEPETDIDGRISDAEGKLLTQGTLLAQLDETRYRLRVESAKAALETTRRQRDVTQIEIDEVIPSEKRAAQANLRYWRSEMARITPLLPRGAVTQSEFDRKRASLESADAKVTQIDANRKGKRAELASLEAQIDEAQQSLEEAREDLADCRLTAPYRGQVADVKVIPGAYVDRGRPVLSVQVMDPIAVEVEVAPGTTRRMQYKDSVTMWFTQTDGSELPLDGIVYMVDPTADPATRTFTVTILLRNRKRGIEVPAELGDRPLARTRDVWKVQSGLVSYESDTHFVEFGAIQQDEQGYFLWKVLNRTTQTPPSTASPVLKVAKVRVTPGKLRVPYLGLWTFAEVAINEGENFDFATELVTGELILPPGVSELASDDPVFFDRKRWLLRPGDLVGVDLAGGAAAAGFYVPLDVIAEESGKYYVMLVKPAEEGGLQASKVEVKLFEHFDTYRRIEAIGDEPLAAGTELVAGGAHYIEHGEKLTIAERVEVPR